MPLTRPGDAQTPMISGSAELRPRRPLWRDAVPQGLATTEPRNRERLDPRFSWCCDSAAYSQSARVQLLDAGVEQQSDGAVAGVGHG
jgi:hypothetical protein